MPEVSEEALAALAKSQEGEAGTGSDRPFWKQYNMIGGFMQVPAASRPLDPADLILRYSAQFAYVGAQVTVATFFINYCNENGGITKSKASLLLSMSLLIFTIARFIGTALLTWIQPDFMMMVYASCVSSLCCSVRSHPLISLIFDQKCILLSILASFVRGHAGIGCVMVIFFFST